MKWSPRPGLNRRPHPYQGCALPLSHVGKKPKRDTKAGDESGRWDSNPRRPAWKAGALPTELHPHVRQLLSPARWRGKDSNLRSLMTADLQSAPFGRSGTPPRRITGLGLGPTRSSRSPILFSSARSQLESWRWDSNPRPPDYKSGALPTELRQRNYNAFANPVHLGWEPEIYSRFGPSQPQSARKRPQRLA